MTRAHRRIAGAIFAVAVFATAGCERLFDKGAKETASAADKKAAAGDFTAAVQLYEAALDGTAKTADIHYKLALLYDDKLKKPLDAIHHLDRYAELTPEGGRIKEVRALRKEEEAKLRTAVAGGSPLSQQEAAALRSEIQRLSQENARLSAQKAAQSAAANAKGDAKQKPIPPGSRTYVVQPGDTLAKISRKFYKSSARASDIQDANFNQLKGTVTIKPGMILTIPK